MPGKRIFKKRPNFRFSFAESFTSTSLEVRALTVPIFSLTSGVPGVTTLAQAQTNTFDNTSNITGDQVDFHIDTSSSGSTEAAQSEANTADGSDFKEAATASQSLQGPTAAGNNSTQLDIFGSLMTQDYADARSIDNNAWTKQSAHARITSGDGPNANVPAPLLYTFGDSTTNTANTAIVDLKFEANYVQSTDTASGLGFKFNTPWFVANWNGQANQFDLAVAQGGGSYTNTDGGNTHLLEYHTTVAVTSGTTAPISYLADLASGLSIPGVYADDPIEFRGSSSFSFSFEMTIQNGDTA